MTVSREEMLAGADLARWCYENPNLAARTIEGLRSQGGSGELRQDGELRLCGYCNTWNAKPCGNQCRWQPTDPTHKQLAAEASAPPQGGTQDLRQDGDLHREVIAGLQSLRDPKAGNAIRYINALAAQGGSIEAALRDAFPHFQDDLPITPEAIKGIGKEYLEMVMGWEPQKDRVEFIDDSGRTFHIYYEPGDEGYQGGWMIDGYVTDAASQAGSEASSDAHAEANEQASEAADNLALIDFIADKIGLPKEDELSRENFLRWLSEASSWVCPCLCTNPPQPVDAAQGKPVAWSYRVPVGKGEWMSCFSAEKPDDKTSDLTPLYAHPPAATGDAAREAVAHALNEWADLGSNAIQWLRNIKDGISTVDEAQAEMASNYERVLTLARAALSQNGGASSPHGIDMVRSCLEGIAEMKDDEPREIDDADWRARALECKRIAKLALACRAVEIGLRAEHYREQIDREPNHGQYRYPDATPRQDGWQCAARKQALPEPADCNWPFCDCDPYASKVMAAVEERAPAQGLQEKLRRFAGEVERCEHGHFLIDIAKAIRWFATEMETPAHPPAATGDAAREALELAREWMVKLTSAYTIENGQEAYEAALAKVDAALSQNGGANATERVIAFLEKWEGGDAGDISSGVGALLGTGSDDVIAKFRAGITAAINGGAGT